MQALFIQQDAIAHLSEAFGIKYTLTEILKKIRLIRNAAIGHPTRQDRSPDKRIYYNYISRMTLSKGGFDLMQCYDQGETRFIDVNLYQAISDQLDEIKAAYETIAITLKEIDKMHKEKYKDKPLIDIFHSSIGYNFEKVAQGIHSPSQSNTRFALSMLGIIQKTYNEFERALNERKDINNYIQYGLNEYKHALSKLELYLKSDESNMSESDARIYLYYAQEQHKHFEQIAKEIDDDYKQADPAGTEKAVSME